jgi:hypothetical protein
MENQKRCKTCDGPFEASSLIFEVAGTDFVFTQSHCDDCIDSLEAKSHKCSRINLEDLLEVLNESL